MQFRSIRSHLLISGLAIIVIVILVSLIGVQQTILPTGAEAKATPANVIYLPAIQSAATPPATPPLMSEGISLPSDWVDADPENHDTEIEGTQEAFNTPIPYLPIPIPNLNTTTVPELDNISISNDKTLNLPSKTHSFYDNIVWSPDGKQFVGHFAGWMTGIDADYLYIGNRETGDFSLWEQNGIWPSWSLDGQFIYFLAPRRDGTKVVINEGLSRPYFDLFRRGIRSESSELVIKDVAPPQAPIAQTFEIINKELLMLDHSEQVVLMQNIDQIIKATSQGLVVSPQIFLTSEASEQKNQEGTHNLNPPTFSVSPDGKFAIIISSSSHSQLVDLEKRSPIQQINGLEAAINISWSATNKKLAYTNRQGLFTYDLATHETRLLVANKDLGFQENDTRGGIALPTWAFEDQVILFVALCSDWVDRSYASNDVQLDYFTFAVTHDGQHLKAIGRYALESVSPNKHHGIIRTLDSATGYFSHTLVDIKR